MGQLGFGNGFELPPAINAQLVRDEKAFVAATMRLLVFKTLLVFNV